MFTGHLLIYTCIVGIIVIEIRCYYEFFSSGIVKSDFGLCKVW